MKFPVGFILLAIPLNQIISIIPTVLGTGVVHPSGLNGSKIFRQGRIEDYRYDSEYDDDDYIGDYGDGDRDLNGGQGQVSANLRNDDDRGRGRRGSFGISTQFWGQIFNIHEHYHKQVGVNWDQDQDECSGIGKRCTSRQPCCKGSTCENWSCAQCAGEGASCAIIKNCCDKDQKCLQNKCTDFCVKDWRYKCSKDVPCCNPAFVCWRSGKCEAREGACQRVYRKNCNALYPCCDRYHICVNDICESCVGVGKSCSSTKDCCIYDKRPLACVESRCKDV